jgi:hypothetical protein
MQRTFPTHDQSTAIVYPGESSLNLPAKLVQRSRLDRTTTLRLLALAPLKGRNRHLDASFTQFSSKSATTIRLISRQRFGSSARTTAFLWHSDRLQRLISQRNFMRLSAVLVQTNRQTMTTYHQHHFAAFSDLGLAYSGAPPFAGTKLPSRKACTHSSFPWASSLLNKARRMSSQVSSSDHWLNRRQQVVYEPYSAGISCQAQPIFKMYRMPLSVRRSSARGRPGPGLRLGISGSMTAHCSSVSSCLLPMRRV